MGYDLAVMEEGTLTYSSIFSHSVVSSGGTTMFQRIAEHMTKELADAVHDDCSSRRRRGIWVWGKFLIK